MKLIVSVVALCALGSSAPGNLLTNGNLDSPGTSASDTIDAWTLEESPGFNAANFEAFANHTPGGEVGLWFRPFAAGPTAAIPVDADLWQEVPATPGIPYTLSAWFLFEEHYSDYEPSADSQTRLYMAYYDGADALLGSVELDVTAVALNDGEWGEYQVGGITPAGTAKIRAGASMSDGIGSAQNPQSAFADDFELVPAPGALGVMVLAGIGVARRRR